MATGTRDLESQYDEINVGFDPNESLLPQTGGRSIRSTRQMRRSLEVIMLDDIPPIIKSANGNIFWADQQCTRRVGLTTTEARLFLQLLQTDQPENLNYDEYKSMFDHFGEEQKRLQQLVDALPWYELDTWRQKAIWQARIQWLDRMKEPRLWLLYLMARRRRILKTASDRIFTRLKEKRRIRMAKAESPLRGRDPQPNGQPMMLNDTTHTSESLIGVTISRQDKSISTVMINEECQTSDTHLNLAARIRDSLSLSPHGERDSHSRSHSSKGRCPVFNDRWEATRGDIKKQVENIMGDQRPYIVIGWFRQSALHPEERILQFDEPADLFITLRKGEIDVRGWRRFFSLKGLRGFGLYKCDISRGAHIPLALNSSQEAVLAQLFLAYRASYQHPDRDVAVAWQGWVQKNLNNNKNNPLEGRYSLQLKYEWSSYRLTFIVAVPLLLSLAIGIWYMIAKHDVVTAWTLAMYIVAAAAALIALMTIVGNLKDV